jgi:hypothetical protein
VQFCANESDAAARSMLADSLLIGGYFVAARHPGRTRPEMLRPAVDRLLDEPWSS